MPRPYLYILGLFIFSACANGDAAQGVVDRMQLTEVTGASTELKRTQNIKVFYNDYFEYQYKLSGKKKQDNSAYLLPINSIENVNEYNYVLDNGPVKIIPVKPFKFNLQNQLNTVFKYQIYTEDRNTADRIIYFSEYYGILYDYNYNDRSSIELVQSGMSKHSDVGPLISYIKSDFERREKHQPEKQQPEMQKDEIQSEY